MEMGGEMETILIRGMSRDGFGVGDEKGRLWLEFYKVDLKQGGKVEKNCYPKLRTWGRLGRMFLANSKLCVAGCTPKADKVDECASFLDLDSDSDSEWKHLPLPVPCLTLGTLDGKIYGHNHHDHERNRYAEDENLGLDWFDFIRDPDPIEEKYRLIEGRLVPDPPNNRILFYMRPGNIYAYYPTHRESRLVASHVGSWSHGVAVAGNIVYITDPGCCDYASLLYAYDLSNSKYLKCVWTSTEVNGVYIFDFLNDFDGLSLLHVPNTNNFWFAAWIPDSSTDNLRLYFVKFQASRTDNDDRILCTPLDLVSSLHENPIHVFDFLLIHGSLNG